MFTTSALCDRHVWVGVQGLPRSLHCATAVPTTTSTCADCYMLLTVQSILLHRWPHTVFTTGQQQWQAQPDQNSGLLARPTDPASDSQGRTLLRSFYPCNLLLPAASCCEEGTGKLRQQPGCSDSRAAHHQSARERGHKEVQDGTRGGRKCRRFNCIPFGKGCSPIEGGGYETDGEERRKAGLSTKDASRRTSHSLGNRPF